MKRWTPLVAVVAMATATAGAPGEPADDPGLELLQQYLDDVRTLEAEFEQSLLDADGALIESSRGTLVIQRPGRFRWSYTEPYEQLLVADGRNVWSFDVDLEQVTVKPQEGVLANTPAILLGGGGSVLDEFEHVASETDERGTVWVTLRPRNADNGFDRVELGFDDGVLRRMLFRDNLEQTTLIALVEVTLNEAVDEALFRFDVPDGVDLVGEPVD